MGTDQLQGTSVLDEKGELLTHDGDVLASLAAGNDDEALHANAAKALGYEFRPISTPKVARKSSDEIVSGSTTLQEDDELKVDLSANTNYAFEAWLPGEAGDNSGMRFAWSAPGSGKHKAYLWTKGDHGQMVSGDPGSLGADQTLSVITTESVIVMIQGYIEVGSTGGTFALQWAQNSSDSGFNTTVYAGSTLTVSPI